MSYETAVRDYLAADEIMGKVSAVDVTVTGATCDVTVTYSGGYSLEQVSLITAVGCCHELPASGTYTLNVEQTPNRVSYTYDWLGVSGIIEHVRRVSESI
jgi:hypothetical protein